METQISSHVAWLVNDKIGKPHDLKYRKTVVSLIHYEQWSIHILYRECIKNGQPECSDNWAAMFINYY